MNLKNIQPPECPEVLTTQEFELVRTIRTLPPERLAVLHEMLEVAESMLAQGADDDVIAAHLLNIYGSV